MIFWAREKTKKGVLEYRFERGLPVKAVKVVDLAENNSFELLDTRDDNKTVACFSAPNFEGKREWLKAIRALKTNRILNSVCRLVEEGRGREGRGGRAGIFNMKTQKNQKNINNHHHHSQQQWYFR